MSEREGFLRAVRERPDDDALRLIYADYLDERGEPLGAFIRLQCELEPLRQRTGDPDIAQLVRREWELLRAHRSDWLGPTLVELEARYEEVDFQFRRGLVETAWLPAEAFVNHAAELEERCPGLREVTLSWARGRGAELAGCPLAGLRALDVVDWLTEADGVALAASPHLVGLRKLSLWLGSRHDPAVCRAVARSKVLRGLEEVRLVQLYGGETTGHRAWLAGRADGLAEVVNRLRRKKVARVERPFERLFPLNEYVGSGLYAGRLPGGRRALAVLGWEKALWLAVFDPEGNHTGTEYRDLDRILVQDREWAYERYHEAGLLEYLAREFGFEPALIHVKEFSIPHAGLSVHHLGFDPDVLEDPDGARSGEEEAYRTVLRDYRFGVVDENFEIDWGGTNYAGPSGTIHST